MTFEMILPQLKKGAFVKRQGWSGAEIYVRLIEEHSFLERKMTPYFAILVEGEGFSMFQPTVCDILADDWVIVDGDH